MDELKPIDKEIIRMLENYPLEPYSAIAKRMERATSTVIRRILGDDPKSREESLQGRGILKGVIASFIPEKLSLVRYSVIMSISQLHQFSLIENALSRHNYLRGFNRFYGEQFGMYAYFDFPQNQEHQLKKFLEYCVEQEYCNDYKIYESMGYRLARPAPLPRYTSDPKNYDLISFWQKRLEKDTNLPRINSILPLDTLEPLHLKLLKDLSTTWKNGNVIDARTKQTDLIQHYRSMYNALAKKTKLTKFEEHLLYNLSDLFDGRNEHNLKVEFGRKYYNPIREIIVNPRWNIERKVTEQNISRAFFIENVPEKEKAQFYRFLTEEIPPFQLGCELFNNGIFLRMTLPPYHDAKMNYLIWTTFKNYKVFSLDYFDKHGFWLPFQPQNYDLEQKSWRTDDYWLWDEIIENIQSRLKNGSFGELPISKFAQSVNNNNGFYKNGAEQTEYLHKHLSNGNTSAVS